MTPAEAEAVRRWTVEKLALHIDNHEPWYWPVVDAALRAQPRTTAAVGLAVADEIRELVDAATTGRGNLLLRDLLDLGDSQQALLLGEHYIDVEVE